jgi:hypothetical protein
MRTKQESRVKHRLGGFRQLRRAGEEPVHDLGAQARDVRRRLREKVNIAVHQVIAKHRYQIEAARRLARTRDRGNDKVVAPQLALLDGELEQLIQPRTARRVGRRGRLMPLP